MLYEVSTKYGILKGIASDVEGVSEFRGIPYAAPPVGENRWRPPQAPSAWEGVRACASYGPACLQTPNADDNFFLKERKMYGDAGFPERISEDCLYLNICTPARTADERLPVMIWIHGGGYVRGCGNEARSYGARFASHGVIVVSINYRLNIFGFFKHPALEEEQGHSGNYALLDQAAAVNWVYENIENFGGDPENITIYGQSAGAKSVECLCVMPQVKGHIRRAIMQSCSFDAAENYDWEFDPPEDMEENSAAFAAFAGADSLRELRAISGEELLKRYTAFISQGHPDFRCICEDGYALFENPGRAMRAGKMHVSELITGCTFEEAQLQRYEPDVTLANYKEKAAALPPVFAPLAEVPVGSDREALETYNRWYAWYDHNVNYALCNHMYRNGKRGWCYSFRRQIPGANHPGAFHGAEIPYVFETLDKSERPFTKEDYELSRVICGYWVNFVKTGDPNGKGLPAWNAFTAESPEMLVLDSKEQKMQDVLTQRMNGLYQTLR